jgi:hypothetical protein
MAVLIYNDGFRIRTITYVHCTTITITVVKEIQLAKIGNRKSVMSHDVLRSLVDIIY